MTPTRHSYSSISCYMQCPARYHYRYRVKLGEESTAAMDRGSRLHGLAQTYMESPTPSCPYELRKIGLKMLQLRQKGALAEQKWYVSRTWKPMTEERADDAKIKAIVDVHYVMGDVLFIHDWKSGREYSHHANQLEFYACVGMAVYPEVKRCQTSAVYIDTGTESSLRSILREMLPKIRKRWDHQIELIEADEDFLASPSWQCKRCPYGISKGGPCVVEHLDD